jgi:hypothetical protein
MEVALASGAEVCRLRSCIACLLCALLVSPPPHALLSPGSPRVSTLATDFSPKMQSLPTFAPPRACASSARRRRPFAAWAPRGALRRCNAMQLLLFALRTDTSHMQYRPRSIVAANRRRLCCRPACRWCLVCRFLLCRDLFCDVVSTSVSLCVPPTLHPFISTPIPFPGYHGDDQSDNRLRQEAEAIGFPVLIKAGMLLRL